MEVRIDTKNIDTENSLPARFEFFSLEFTLLLPQGAHLGEYPPNRIRSIIFSSFKETVCTQNTTCETCILQNVCLYTKYFTPKAHSTFLVHKGNQIPPPFSLKMDWKTKKYPKNSLLKFELIFYSNITNLLPFLIAGLKSFERRGLGKLWYPFKLKSIFSGTSPIYSNDFIHIPQPVILSTDKKENSNGVTIRFLSPTFIKNKATPHNPPTFADIVKSIALRFSLISYFYKNTSWQPPRKFFHLAENVKYRYSSYSWHSFVRFSHKQKNHMPLEGFTGTLHVEGNIKPYIFLLKIAPFLHIGSKTSFGLGQNSVVFWNKNYEN